MTAAATLEAPPPVRRRFALFDSLRGIAVLAILVYHVASITGAARDSVPGRTALVIGALAVSLFFSISGFLLYRPFVAARLAGRPMPDLKRFARRRVGRIVPPYWTAVTVLAVFPGIAGVFSGDFWRYYGFLQLYWDDSVGRGIPVAWTLCVEVTFYLLLPAWGIVFRRASVRTDVLALGCAIAAGLVLQVLAARQTIPRVVADALPGQLTWFGLGMLLAVWSTVVGQREPGAIVRHATAWWATACAGIALLVVIAQPGGLAELIAALNEPQPLARAVPRALLSVVVIAALMLPAVFGEHAGGLPRRFLAWRPVAYVGVVSYSLYLYHLTIAQLLGLERDPLHFSSRGLGLADDLGPAPTPVMLVLTLAAATAVGTISYQLVERPFLRAGGPRARAAGSAGPPG